MSIPPNSFPQGYQIAYNVISGGHYYDPAPDQSGTARAVDPLRHGSQVDQTQMPFVTMLRTPTQSALEETPFPPEPGAIVAVSYNTGDPTSRAVIGQPNELNNSQSVPGNSVAMGQVLQAIIKLVNKNRPGKYREENDKGADVREIQNLGEWLHNLTKGLPTHAALFPLAGQVLPAIKQIDTAIKQFASILGQGAIGSLPGSQMNLSSLFNKMNKQQKDKIKENMSPELADALDSIMTLLTEGESSGTYITSNRIDEETFTENAIEMLSQCTNLNDLISCLDRLRYDESLHGLDKLGEVEIRANSAYGEVVFTADKNGNLKQNQQNAQQILSVIQQFVGLLGSVQAGGQGKQMFGDEARKVVDAVGRLPPEAGIKRILDIMPRVEGSRKERRSPSHKFNLDGMPEEALGIFKLTEQGGA